MNTAEATARVGKNAERRHPRFRTGFPVKLVTQGSTYQGIAHDLSEGGLGVEVPADLIEGENIHLQFTLPNSQSHFTVTATVRHANAHRCGLEFKRLTRRESDELWRVCRALSAAA